MSASTMADIAEEVRSALARDDEAFARRLAFDFVKVFDVVDKDAAVSLVAVRPERCGDRRYDALLAAIVEHMCAREGLAVPAWAQEPWRFLDRWWFVSGLRDLHASALVQSPISFARRGVFVCDGALSYA